MNNNTKNDVNIPNQPVATPPQHQLKLPKIKDSIQLGKKSWSQLAGKVPEASNLTDRTAQEDRRRNLKNSLTVFINNEKKATEPNKQQPTDKQPQQVAHAARTRNVLNDCVDSVSNKSSTSLARAGFGPQKVTRSPHENSPLTPNFVMGNNSKTREEKSDFSVTAD